MNPLILLLPLADKVPAPNDVKAGWGAFGLFIALAVAVALLGWSLTRHLRKARENAELGVFDPGDKPRQVAPRRDAP
jgi:hypothetical protein